jgi:hypothetical protein
MGAKASCVASRAGVAIQAAHPQGEEMATREITGDAKVEADDFADELSDESLDRPIQIGAHELSLIVGEGG